MADQERTEPTTGRRNPADNLTSEARRKGGKHSAQMQRRDQHGQFAGRKGENASGNAAGRPEGASGRTEQHQGG